MPTEIELRQELLFPSGVYNCDLPNFLPLVKRVSNKHLKNTHRHPGAPLMSDQFAQDPALKEFTQELLEVCHYILSKSGYRMCDFVTFFTAMWTQQHEHLSLMEQHVHGHGDQLVGFYCLDAPKGCGRVMFHDPRPGKVQVNLPEDDMSLVTLASDAVNFELIPGRLIIAPAWLPHSFTRNMNKTKPARFVHFNVGVRFQPSACNVGPVCKPPAAEVV